MAGFLLAAIPILSLGLGGVEAAYWASLRQTLSLALMDAARAGATQQARPQAIAQAFEHGLHMSYPDPRAAARALRNRQADLGTPWHIRIAQPTPAAFLDHADPHLKGPRDHPGQPLIRNDYQPQQQARHLAQGWPAGRGPRSGLTIHEANTLVLELRWPHRPLMPGLEAMVRTLAPLSTTPEAHRLMAAGYLPFRRRVSVAMHSHPAAWPDLADGRVTHATDQPAVPTLPPGQTDLPAQPPATTPPPGQTPDPPAGMPDTPSPADGTDTLDDTDAAAPDAGEAGSMEGEKESGADPAVCEPAP